MKEYNNARSWVPREL